jgi:RNA polymerase sigma factor (sigma-70 family)
MPDSDAALIAMAVSGHADAFPEVLRRHGRAMHAYLARRSDRDTADDLVCEVFLRAFAARRQYDRRWPDAKPWLYGIARNVLREHRRRAGTTEPGVQVLGDVEASEAPWPEVDARLDAAAMLPSLRRALARLADADREVLLLVTWEGLTPAAAALALGIPAGTARSRLHRARTFIRGFVDAEADSQPASYQEA